MVEWLTWYPGRRGVTWLVLPGPDEDADEYKRIGHADGAMGRDGVCVLCPRPGVTPAEWATDIWRVIGPIWPSIKWKLFAHGAGGFVLYELLRLMARDQTKLPRAVCIANGPSPTLPDANRAAYPAFSEYRMKTRDRYETISTRLIVGGQSVRLDMADKWREVFPLIREKVTIDQAAPIAAWRVARQPVPDDIVGGLWHGVHEKNARHGARGGGRGQRGGRRGGRAGRVPGPPPWLCK